MKKMMIALLGFGLMAAQTEAVSPDLTAQEAELLLGLERQNLEYYLRKTKIYGLNGNMASLDQMRQKDFDATFRSSRESGGNTPRMNAYKESSRYVHNYLAREITLNGCNLRFGKNPEKCLSPLPTAKFVKAFNTYADRTEALRQSSEKILGTYERCVENRTWSDYIFGGGPILKRSSCDLNRKRSFEELQLILKQNKDKK